MLEIHHLKVLRAIAKEGSISGAARFLRRSHPTVAHHLKSLEGHIGAELVSRGTDGAKLTKAGESLVERADVILRLVQEAEQEARSNEGLSPCFRVGTTPWPGQMLAPPLLRRMQDSEVPTSLVQGDLPQLLRMLLVGEIHLAFVSVCTECRRKLGRKFVFVPLFEDPFVLALPTGHPAALSERVPLEDLRSEKWIAPEESHEPLAALFQTQDGLEVAYRARVDDYPMMLTLVAAELGVALVPRSSLADDKEGVASRLLAGLQITQRIGAVMLSDTFRVHRHDMEPLLNLLHPVPAG
ncbi:LysR family transcriptional regulator [Streptomyces sp. NPDC048282]|uniref:LysR family transcriptional regulator n=1 Tax=Streptomyces sp. NPDC048282 TaxID=3365528 RepID=UPI0037116142